MYFQYGEKETAYLISRDARMGAAIEEIGHINRAVDGDLFSSVVHHIIGQQISTVAQATIWRRLTQKAGVVSADTILALAPEVLQGLGMTFKKAGYIRDFAEKVHSGAFDLKALYGLSDGEVIAALSSLRGIGVWTAEMLLIFCLQRPNVVSFGDLAIMRGMRMLYHHKSIDHEKFERYKKRYAPYGTVASLYLWAIAGGAIEGMRDYAPKRKRPPGNNKGADKDPG